MLSHSQMLSDAFQQCHRIVRANQDLVKQQKEDKQAVEDKKLKMKKLQELAENQAALESQKATYYQNKLI